MLNENRVQPFKFCACHGRPNSKQKGAIIILTAILLLTLIGIGALAIDIGNLFVVRNQLQNAADAAALAGANCLHRDANCVTITNPATPNWSSAEAKAGAAITLNKADNQTLEVASVTSGWWDLTHTITTLHSTKGIYDAPAVQVTVTKQGSDNGGPVLTFLAKVFGESSVPVSATAVAGINPPGSVSDHSLFPVAVPQCLFQDTGLWNNTTNSPTLYDPINPLTDVINGLPAGFQPSSQTEGQAYYFAIGSSYHYAGCQIGQWTSFNLGNNDTTTIRDLIDRLDTSKTEGLTQPSIGESTWLEPGTKNSLYKDVDDCSAAGTGSCEWVYMPVTNSVSEAHIEETVVAYACVHILSAIGGDDKYIVAQLSNDVTHCQMASSGGAGPAYGVSTNPRLFK